ncbi:hypothetical protein FXO38_30261 [Capsicum annuum]|nr:hypothetical protein FXO38_30261 [Capsicum annuum]
MPEASQPPFRSCPPRRQFPSALYILVPYLVSPGFNAAVAGCFFAVESVLWPSPAESSSSLINTTSMVILSAVIASVVSEIGLGSEPAFAVPAYDFRTPTGMKRSEARDDRFIGEVMRFKEMCASNNDVHTDPNKKRLIL